MVKILIIRLIKKWLTESFFFSLYVQMRGECFMRKKNFIRRYIDRHLPKATSAFLQSFYPLNLFTPLTTYMNS